MLWVKFYLGQNEDYSPGDGVSAPRTCSEEVGKVSVFMILVAEGGERAVRHTFWQKVAARLLKVPAGHEEQTSFLDTRRCKKLSSSDLLKTSNSLKTCSASFSQSASRLISALNSSQGLEDQWLQQLVTLSL